MSTKVQRKVLWWMIDAGGEMVITSGHKRVLIGKLTTTQEPAIAGNQNLIFGLINNKYVERIGTEPGTIEYLRYRITNVGRKAAGKERPDPAEHCNVPHRNKVFASPKIHKK